MAQIKYLQLQEARSSRQELTLDEAWWLQDLGVATCTSTRVPGVFDVRVGNVAGLFRREGCSVEVLPKLPVGELMWLLTYAATGVKLDAEEVHAAPTETAEALAALLIAQVSKVMRGGLPRGYWEQHESSATLRGRLRLADQLNKHLGRLYPLEQSFDDFGVDIAENQLMRAACYLTLQALITASRPRSEGLRADLQRLIRGFDGVQALQLGARLPTWTKSPRNRSAWAAVSLAELILSGATPDATHGSHVTSGLLIAVWQVFEAAVARGLQEVRPSWRVSTQHSFQLVQGARSLTMRPDLVIEKDGALFAVADTKYKAPDTKTSDLYQLFTYAKFLGLEQSHLIYAEGLQAHRNLHVGATGVTVMAHGISLKQPSTDFLQQINKIAELFEA